MKAVRRETQKQESIEQKDRTEKCGIWWKKIETGTCLLDSKDTNQKWETVNLMMVESIAAFFIQVRKFCIIEKKIFSIQTARFFTHNHKKRS
jgi:hypothetical protein